MKTHLQRAIPILLVLVLICFKARGQTNVSGFISANTTWTLSGSPYIIIGNTLLSQGFTLTIEPGVIVKFSTGKALQIDGELIAIGIPHNRIVFTSDQSNPVAGDWAKIHFADISADAVFNTAGDYVSGCIMKYCDVLYGGSLGFGQIHIETSSPLISQCNIRHSAADGIFCDLSGFVFDSTDVTDCAGYGLNFENWCGTLIEGDSIVNNAFGGIHLGGSCANQVLYIRNNYFNLNSTQGALSMSGYSRKVIIRENIFINNSGQNSGIISFNNGMYRDTIECNTFINNSPSGINQAVITTNPYGSRGLIKDNLFEGNTALQGAYITAIWSGNGPPTTFTFTNNVFRNNSSDRCCYFSPAITNTHLINITHNEFLNNTATAVIFIDGYQTNNSTFTPVNLKYNSFLDSVQQIKFHNGIPFGSPNLYVDSNFWGSTSASYLDAVIYDFFDDANWSVVYYNPVLPSALPVNTNCSALTTGINSPVAPYLNSVLYPNPATGSFIITFGDIIDTGTLEIYNLFGQKILHEKIYRTSKKEINLSNISVGIYLVKINAEGKQFTNKLIVKKD